MTEGEGFSTSAWMSIVCPVATIFRDELLSAIFAEDWNETMPPSSQTSVANTDVHKLEELAAQARLIFSRSVFWNVSRRSDPVVEARNIGRQLEKHGGMRGLRYAALIEEALVKAAETTWRQLRFSGPFSISSLPIATRTAPLRVRRL